MPQVLHEAHYTLAVPLPGRLSFAFPNLNMWRYSNNNPGGLPSGSMAWTRDLGAGRLASGKTWLAEAAHTQGNEAFEFPRKGLPLHPLS